MNHADSSSHSGYDRRRLGKQVSRHRTFDARR